MIGDLLPPADHVARFCDRKYISERQNVEPGAFMLRKDEKYLSVQWLELLKKQNRLEEIAEARVIIAKRMKIRPNTKIAVLNVGGSCDYVFQESGYAIRMVHQPEPSYEAHSGIFGTEQYPELLAELILETVQEFHPE